MQYPLKEATIFIQINQPTLNKNEGWYKLPNAWHHYQRSSIHRNWVILLMKGAVIATENSRNAIFGVVIKSLNYPIGITKQRIKVLIVQQMTHTAWSHHILVKRLFIPHLHMGYQLTCSLDCVNLGCRQSWCPYIQWNQLEHTQLERYHQPHTTAEIFYEKMMK